MRINLRSHARERMKQRHITMAQLQQVVEDPNSSTFDPEMVSYRLESLVDGRILKVWVRAPWPPASDMVDVKSAAWKGGK